MSPRELSDAQLDALLGQVSNPPNPSNGLAEQIVARAGATPQRPANRFAPSPRHRRRRPFVWTTIIAANALAAAAAASSWDGQGFNFHRLADLPNRVAAVIHLPHHHGREPERSEQGRAAPPARPFVAAGPARPPKVRQIAIPITASLGTRVPVLPPHRRGQAAVAASGHSSGWVPRHNGIDKIKTVHRIAQMPALGRRTVRQSPSARPLQTVQPTIGRELPVEPPLTRNLAAAPPGNGNNHRFSGRFGNNWRPFAPRAGANRREGGLGRPRRWPKWGRDLNRPRRNAGRPFARRF